VRVIRAHSPHEFARVAADFAARQMTEKPHSTLALPTGRTPVDFYAELVKRSLAGELSLAHAQLFNLDEYCGLPAADPRTYAAFLYQHLIAPLELPQAQVRLLRGDAADLEAECRDYDAAIDACGGIDLCVLGLGTNGHIAFNEPGSAWDRRTHIVPLSPAIRAEHQRQARSAWETPSRGITIGIQDVLAARQVLLLIGGARKQAAVAALYRGVPDLNWPVTCLLAHRRLTVIELCVPEESP
jgi:glucosamine-6-phosphate deaminase